MKILDVGRELTVYQVAELRKAWLLAYASGVDRVDLSRVAEIDGSGAQLLASLWRMAVRDGRPLEFHDPSDVLLEALRVLGAMRVVAPTVPGPVTESAGAGGEHRHA